jgi:hypothetical protein
LLQRLILGSRLKSPEGVVAQLMSHFHEVEDYWETHAQ